MSSPIRLAIVASHPIQYLCPWFQLLAKQPSLDLTVFFYCDHGQQASYDEGFGATFRWDRPLTEGFKHEFMTSVHPNAAPYGFWRLANPGLWNRIREFDAIIVSGWSYASDLLAIASARAHGVKVLLRAESNLDSWQPRPKWKALSREIVLGQLFRQVDGFLAIGSRNAALYRSHGIPEERVFLAPYAVDNEFFIARRRALMPGRVELRAKLGVTDDRPVIVSAGKLIPRKAPLDLVRAFAQVRQELPARLVFLGDGELRSSVLTLSDELGVAGDVVVTGFKQQAEMAETYVAADLFAFPSHFETWGLVLNEAMLFGLPVLCSGGVSASEDLIEPGLNGEIFPAGDVEALSRLLNWCLSDRARLSVMGEKAAERIESWNLESIVDGTLRALRSLGL